jgi:hypothetical protein
MAMRLRAHAPAAREQRPGLIVWAAACRRLDAITLLAELGFNVNALGRTDIPAEAEWHIALHEAAKTDRVRSCAVPAGLSPAGGKSPNDRRRDRLRW